PASTTTTTSDRRVAAFTQLLRDLADAAPPKPRDACLHDPALGRHPCKTIPVRQHLADRRELRGLAVLRAAAPELVDLPRIVLSVPRQRPLPRAGAVGH